MHVGTQRSPIGVAAHVHPREPGGHAPTHSGGTAQIRGSGIASTGDVTASVSGRSTVAASRASAPMRTSLTSLHPAAAQASARTSARRVVECVVGTAARCYRRAGASTR